MSETRELDRELEHENLLVTFCEMFLLAVSFEAVTFFFMQHFSINVQFLKE